jgi:hypothetical protein
MIEIDNMMTTTVHCAKNLKVSCEEPVIFGSIIEYIGNGLCLPNIFGIITEYNGLSPWHWWIYGTTVSTEVQKYGT